MKMETQKIVNLLNSPRMNTQNLLQRNGTLLTVNQKVVICMKIQ